MTTNDAHETGGDNIVIIVCNDQMRRGRNSHQRQIMDLLKHNMWYAQLQWRVQLYITYLNLYAPRGGITSYTLFAHTTRRGF